MNVEPVENMMGIIGGPSLWLGEPLPLHQEKIVSLFFCLFVFIYILYCICPPKNNTTYFV